MGFATVYCDGCGAQILGAEFEKGRAVARANKYYCSECAPKLPPEAPGMGMSNTRQTTRVKRSSGELSRNTDIIRNLQSLGGSGHGNTTRSMHAHHAPSPTPAGLGTGAKAGLLAGSLLALIGIGVIVSKMGGSGSAAPVASTGKAKEAYDKVASMPASTPAKDLLDAARRAKREAEGTEYEAKLQEMITAASARVDEEDRAAKIQKELNATIEEARVAEDPSALVPVLEQLATRARTEAPAMETKVREAIGTVLSRAAMRILGAIDMTMSVTPNGLKRVLSDLDDAEKHARKAGVAGTGAVDAVAKKKIEAQEMFSKSAEAQYTDLETRVKKMLADLRYTEAETAVKSFVSDYKGTSVEAKAQALVDVVAKASKSLDSAWIDANKAEAWKNEMGDGKVTFENGVITLQSDGAEGPEGNTTRRITLAASDETWQNVDVDFEVNVERFGGAVVMFSRDTDPVQMGLRVRKGNEGLLPGQWVRCTLRVLGDQLTIGGTGIQQITQKINKIGRGGVAFGIYQGGKIQLRNVKIRKIK